MQHTTTDIIRRILASRAVKASTVRFGVRGPRLTTTPVVDDNALSRVVFDFEPATKAGEKRNQALREMKPPPHFGILVALADRIEPYRPSSGIVDEIIQFVGGTRKQAPLAALPAYVSRYLHLDVVSLLPTSPPWIAPPLHRLAVAFRAARQAIEDLRRDRALHMESRDVERIFKQLAEFARRIALASLERPTPEQAHQILDGLEREVIERGGYPKTDARAIAIAVGKAFDVEVTEAARVKRQTRAATRAAPREGIRKTRSRAMRGSSS